MNYNLCWNRGVFMSKTNLEIMNAGIDYTTHKYNEAFKDSMSQPKLELNADIYSAEAMIRVINATDGVCNDYTRQNNLRYEMASLGKDAIKNELLKNIVNVATYQVIYDTRAGKELGVNVSPDMTHEQTAVVVSNAMSMYGVEKGYEMLSDPKILLSACETFSFYQSKPERKAALANIAQTNPGAITLNNELDLYYARYGDPKAPNGVDVSNLESYGYDANGGFSGFSRK